LASQFQPSTVVGLPSSGVHACALEIELHIPASGSLKEKRSVIKHLLDTARHRYGVAASETDYQDTWQRAQLGFAAVGPDTSHVAEVLDSVERFVWSHPEVEVLEAERTWLDHDS
jgi:uncharacterized protein YlxP (DUF503 family)